MAPIIQSSPRGLGGGLGSLYILQSKDILDSAKLSPNVKHSEREKTFYSVLA